ncbi:MAG: DUF2029 domain-containing protein [Robiginitomaculum sp.]|nr:DUF2029 domain-containing protein [Robiginitomaculum sp.]
MQFNSPLIGFVLRFTIFFFALIFCYGLVRQILTAQNLPLAGDGAVLIGRDFMNYWMGAKLTLSGEAEILFDKSAYYLRLKQEFGPNLSFHNWSYPPNTLLLLWPFGFLPYMWAYAVWTAAGVASFFYAVRQLVGNKIAALVLVAAPHTFLCRVTGQNGLFTAALIILAFVNIKQGKPIIAGILIGLLTFKPQLGLLIPVALLLSRQWRVFYVAAIVTLLFASLSVLVLGLDPWFHYIGKTVPLQREILANAGLPFNNMVPSAFMTAKNLGFSLGTAWGMQAIISTLALGALVWGFLRRQAAAIQFVLLVITTLLFSPYMVNYDMLILAPAAYVLMRYLREIKPNFNYVWSALFAFASVLAVGGYFVSDAGVEIYLPGLLLILAVVIYAIILSPARNCEAKVKNTEPVKIS